MSASNKDPEIRIEDHYVDGYVPVSLHAPHSSLLKTSTWVGMGLLLSAVALAGITLFGLGSYTVGTQEHWATYSIVGVVATVIAIAAGSALIYYGQRDYRAYVKRSGRKV